MIVGTAGHIDHGKTALVRALTGVDTDRLKEEKARGISIDLGYAYLPGADGVILGFVDVPGHEKFIHNMLAGATGIDYALLVVAADDSVMPQTREHLAILDLLGISRGVVALTKIDLVPAEAREIVIEEIREALAQTTLTAAAIVPVSSVTGEGVERLRTILFDAAAQTGVAGGAGQFRLAVDRSFALPGIGTVVTGTVLSGAVGVGDRVTISPSGLAARVRTIHAQNREAQSGKAGERCALNLAGEGITKESVSRGDMVLDPALHAPTDRIDATLRLLSGEAKPITQWMPARLHHASSEVGVRVVLLEDGPLVPGGIGRIQLVLERPIAATAHDPFILRDTSAQRTIGGGRFLDLRAPQRRCRTPERRAQLDAIAIRDHEAALAALLEQPPFTVDIQSFARDRGLAANAMQAIAAKLALVMLGDGAAFSQDRWNSFKESIAASLKKFHADNPQARGMSLDRLRQALMPRPSAPTVQLVAQALAKAGDISLDGAVASLRDHAMQLPPADAALWAKILPQLSAAARFRPQRVGDIATQLSSSENNIRRLMKSLARMGQVIEVAEDHFFLRATVAEMAGIAADIAVASTNGEFSAAQFRDRLESPTQTVGRKVAIQILEFFDRSGVTLRRGDLRRINPQRRNHFGAVPPPAESGREAPPVGRPVFKTGRGR